MYPEIADVSCASSGLTRLMRTYFSAKTDKDVAATVGHFSPDIVYSDAVLGWVLDYDEVHGVYAQFMPLWGEAMNYPTRLLGDEKSAVVFMTCTPEMFGQEALCIAAADFREGKIVRWVDYWDTRHFGLEAARQLAAARPAEPGQSFPSSFGEDRVEGSGSERIAAVVAGLTDALRRADPQAASLFSSDCVVEDMTLRMQIRGRLALERYFGRALLQLPYGSGVRARHVLGSDLGGGFEWTRGDSLRGISSLELDDDGLITRMTSVWDGALLGDEEFAVLASRAYEPAVAAAVPAVEG